jgi:hypothetical protein
MVNRVETCFDFNKTSTKYNIPLAILFFFDIPLSSLKDIYDKTIESLFKIMNEEVYLPSLEERLKNYLKKILIQKKEFIK